MSGLSVSLGVSPAHGLFKPLSWGVGGAESCPEEWVHLVLPGAGRREAKMLPPQKLLELDLCGPFCSLSRMPLRFMSARSLLFISPCFTKGISHVRPGTSPRGYRGDMLGHREVVFGQQGALEIGTEAVFRETGEVGGKQRPRVYKSSAVASSCELPHKRDPAPSTPT